MQNKMVTFEYFQDRHAVGIVNLSKLDGKQRIDSLAL